MRLGSAFGAFLDPVADKVSELLCPCCRRIKRFVFFDLCVMGLQLMVAATLILLCTKPMDAVVVLGPVPWLVTVPSIAIIGREVRY